MTTATDHFSGQDPTCSNAHVGRDTDRVDGRAKVTGAARYSAEFTTSGLVHGCVLNSPIARGRIVHIDAAVALDLPGVLAVFTHENRPDLPWFHRDHQDKDTPTAHFLPLYDDQVHYSGQPIALVVAKDPETASYACTLLQVQYEREPHQTNLAAALEDPTYRKVVRKTPDPRGDAARAYANAPIQVRSKYHFAIEHHNPMAPHAATVMWHDDGSITVHDKTQGPMSTRDYICDVFGFSKKQVQVISPYVGGAFGLALRPQYQLFLAIMAARELKHSVRVVLTRKQMFTLGYRPAAIQTIALAADRDGRLVSVRHETVQNTSQLEYFEESSVKWSALLYQCPNVELGYKLAPLDLYTPTDMRAPGAATGVNAFEQAIDEMAYRVGLDPLAFRLKNYAERDQIKDKDFSSKALRDCYAQGAKRFGWAQRSHEPRTMRDGHELVGWGLATGIWEAFQQEASARATLTRDGHLEVATAAADIGTGTYTILTQIAADAFGLPLSDVTTKLGDSSLPWAPIEGGSSGAASFGSAVKAACEALKKALGSQAIQLPDSPLKAATSDELIFTNGHMCMRNDPSRRVSLAELVQLSDKDTIQAEASAAPNQDDSKRYSSYAHSAVFVEVRIDEQLGQVRVTRVVNAVAAGKILNPKTAANQIMGGVVWGISKALYEHGMVDHHAGRFMNHNLAEYHIPTNADIDDIAVIFVQEDDRHVNALGVKGVGEIGIVGTAAAIANAIFHATGKRYYEFPITADQIMLDAPDNEIPDIGPPGTDARRSAG